MSFIINKLESFYIERFAVRLRHIDEVGFFPSCKTARRTIAGSCPPSHRDDDTSRRISAQGSSFGTLMLAFSIPTRILNLIVLCGIIAGVCVPSRTQLVS